MRSSGVLPPRETAERLIRIFELEKAVYELGYELAHRPDWVGIPVAGILRLLDAEVRAGPPRGGPGRAGARRAPRLGAERRARRGRRHRPRARRRRRVLRRAPSSSRASDYGFSLDGGEPLRRPLLAVAAARAARPLARARHVRVRVDARTPVAVPLSELVHLRAARRHVHARGHVRRGGGAAAASWRSSASPRSS